MLSKRSRLCSTSESANHSELDLSPRGKKHNHGILEKVLIVASLQKEGVGAQNGAKLDTLSQPHRQAEDRLILCERR